MTFHPPPKPTETIRIRGQVVYVGGPWGTNRPVRHVSVNYLLYEPNAPTSFGADSTGIAVGTATVGQDGRFFLEASAVNVPQNIPLVEDVLELQNTNTMEWDVMPIDGVVWGKSGSQDVGVLKVGWEPILKSLAWVDSEKYRDIRYLAKKLVKLLERSPDWPAFALKTSIRLQREEDGRREVWDSVKSLFEALNSRKQDTFPYDVMREMDKIASLKSQSDSVEGSLIDYLKVISQMDIKAIEKGDLQQQMLTGIWKARGWDAGGYNGSSDSGWDAAAACVLIYCAARMVIDEAKVSVMFSNRTVKGPPAGSAAKYKIFDVTVGG